MQKKLDPPIHLDLQRREIPTANLFVIPLGITILVLRTNSTYLGNIHAD